MFLKDVELPYGQEIRTGTSDSILSALYRSILNDIGIDESRFTVLIAKYIKKITPLDEQKEISSIRANARKELMKSTMTWKVFVKGIRALNVRKIDIGVDLQLLKGDVLCVTVKRGLVLDPNFAMDKNDTDRPEQVISLLFHDILYQLNINTKKFNELIKEYIIRANIPTNIKEVSNTRGSLKKELMKASMSWKVFSKGMLFLNVTRFDIGINLYHTNGKITTHYRSVNLDSSS